MTIVGHLINGEIRTDAERLQDVFNPATGLATKQVALATKATVEEAIEAAQNTDYSKVRTLQTILANPFDEQPEFDDYANLPPEWGKKLEISCSS